jgi:hypothetical protein
MLRVRAFRFKERVKHFYGDESLREGNSRIFGADERHRIIPLLEGRVLFY